MEKDCLHCISRKSEPLLSKLCGIALGGSVPLSEVGSTLSRNLDDGTT